MNYKIIWIGMWVLFASIIGLAICLDVKFCLSFSLMDILILHLIGLSLVGILIIGIGDTLGRINYPEK